MLSSAKPPTWLLPSLKTQLLIGSAGSRLYRKPPCHYHVKEPFQSPGNLLASPVVAFRRLVSLASRLTAPSVPDPAFGRVGEEVGMIGQDKHFLKKRVFRALVELLHRRGPPH